MALCALVGVAFIRTLYGLEDLFDRLWRGPEWIRPATGGLILGAILVVLPQMYGVGYPVLEGALDGRYATGMLILLMAGKVLATSVTIAIGGSGGVFAPSLFLGAMIGTAYGQLVNAGLPGITGPAGTYGLVAMGAAFAAAARAPMTAAIIIFELTDEYRIILPLLFAVALATGVANLLTEDTIYTLKLRRRGIDITKRDSDNVMRRMHVSDAMQPAPHGLAGETPVAEAVASFTEQRRDALPVIDREKHYRGTVTARHLEEAMRKSAMTTPIGDLATETPIVGADDTLDEALDVLVNHEFPGLPVLNRDDRIVGWLTHHDVLREYVRRRSGARRKKGNPRVAFIATVNYSCADGA